MMNPYVKNLGKVRPTTEGDHNITKEYDILSIVTVNSSSYISRKFVPAGTSINNEEYWQLLAKGGTSDNNDPDIDNEQLEQIINDIRNQSIALTRHIEDNNVHVTSEEKNKWNQGVVSNEEREKWNDGIVSDEEREKWNQGTENGGGEVSGVKGNAELEYRKGNVNITPENIGLGNVDNTADKDKNVAHALSSDKSTEAGYASYSNKSIESEHADVADALTVKPKWRGDGIETFMSIGEQESDPYIVSYAAESGRATHSVSSTESEKAFKDKKGNVIDETYATKEELAEVSTRNKGYFAYLSALQSAHPSPSVGDKAFVGSTYPYDIYVVSNGQWTNSGNTGGDESLNLEEYQEKEEGKGLINSIAASIIDSAFIGEFLKVVTDSLGRMIESIDVNGDKVIYGNLDVRKTIKGYVKEVAGKALIDVVFADSQSYIDNEEWLKVWEDTNGRILLGINSKGELVIPKLNLNKEFLADLEAALIADGFTTGEGGASSAQVETNTRNITSLTTKVNNLEEEVDSVKEETLDEATRIANEVFSSPIDGTNFTEGLWQQINASGGGTINNAADDEDLTVKTFSNGSTVLKFADKNYLPSIYSGLGEVILRKNIVDGSNILDISLFENITDTTFIVRYDFDLDGQSLTLGSGNKLKFVGGSIKNGNITLSRSNELLSDRQYQCFYNIKFEGKYSKVLPLSLLGVVSDGEDKFPILSMLPELLMPTQIVNYAPVFERVSINGEILCTSNGFNVPANVSIYGENGGAFKFTSGEGDYCMSISQNCRLYDLKIYNNTTEFSGDILISSSNIYDLSRNLFGCANLTLSRVDIWGQKYAAAEDCKATGFKLYASNEESSDNFYYFTSITLDDVTIEWVANGIHAVIDNHPADKFAWGNEINADVLYIRAAKVGILFNTKENETTNKIQDSGFSCINNYVFQAITRSALAFDIQTVNQFRILRMMSWDNNVWGVVRGGAVVSILFDSGVSGDVNSEVSTDSYNTPYLSVNDNKYFIYKGTLDRRFKTYNY